MVQVTSVLSLVQRSQGLTLAHSHCAQGCALYAMLRCVSNGLD